jgi:hypothetical protein
MGPVQEVPHVSNFAVSAALYEVCHVPAQVSFEAVVFWVDDTIDSCGRDTGVVEEYVTSAPP